MAQSVANIESVIAVARLPDLGQDVYTNANPLDLQAGVRSLRGSILVAQAISAASTTVTESYHLSSSQSSFLNPTNPDDKLIYRVERTVDGRMYATRTVRTEQNGSLVYLAVLSFQNSGAMAADNVLSYGLPLPDLDGAQPDEVDKERHAGDAGEHDWRPLGMEMSEDPSQFRLRGFVRSPTTLSSSAGPAVHLAAFGFASDEMSVGPALAANPLRVGRGFRNVSLLASLTHNVSFHEPGARIDDWVVLERDTTWGAHGRVLVSQRMWDFKTGRLVMTVSQEALILLKQKQAKM